MPLRPTSLGLLDQFVQGRKEFAGVVVSLSAANAPLVEVIRTPDRQLDDLSWRNHKRVIPVHGGPWGLHADAFALGHPFRMLAAAEEPRLKAVLCQELPNLIGHAWRLHIFPFSTLLLCESQTENKKPSYRLSRILSLASEERTRDIKLHPFGYSSFRSGCGGNPSPRRTIQPPSS